MGISPGGGDNISTGGVPPHLRALYLGGAESRDRPDNEMLGLGRGT